VNLAGSHQSHSVLLKYFDHIREIRLRISHAIDCRRKKQKLFSKTWALTEEH
jgi:hypothetical protein